MSHVGASMIADAARRQAAAMEEMCERSLIDPQRRGVLVTTTVDFDTLKAETNIELSADVPWGTIREVRIP